MCGRYKLSTPVAQVAAAFQAAPPADPTLFQAPPRYNIAPSQPVLAVLVEHRQQPRQLKLMRWGLVPHWANDPAIGNRMINARSETVADKPAFRDALKYRRCLIPVDGFYEWQAQGKGPKQPFLIQRADGLPFALAGLWEHWQDAHGNELETVTILTTAANSLMQSIHPRMPVILPPSSHQAWLNPDQQDIARVLPLLQPYAGDDLVAIPVSRHVNSPGHEGPQCAAPLPPSPPSLPPSSPSTLPFI